MAQTISQPDLLRKGWGFLGSAIHARSRRTRSAWLPASERLQDLGIIGQFVERRALPAKAAQKGATRPLLSRFAAAFPSAHELVVPEQLAHRLRNWARFTRLAKEQIFVPKRAGGSRLGRREPVVGGTVLPCSTAALPIPGQSRRRLPRSFWKIILDGLAQKTPLLLRCLGVTPINRTQRSD